MRKFIDREGYFRPASIRSQSEGSPTGKTGTGSAATLIERTQPLDGSAVGDHYHPLNSICPLKQGQALQGESTCLNHPTIGPNFSTPATWFRFGLLNDSC